MYIYNMIEAIDWDGEETLTFLSAETPPVLIHDPLSLAYKREIVSLASKCGRTFTQTDPVADEATIRANYNTVETEIISFGGQIFNAAKDHFSTVFTDASRKNLPCKPLIEWNVIQRLINPKAASDPTTSWNELSRLVQLSPTLTEAWLTDWIAQITQHRSDLILSRGTDTVDSMIIPNVISRIKNVQVDTSIPENLNWKIESSTWEREYEKNAATLVWETLKGNILRQIGRNKNPLLVSDPNVGGQRPRLHPSAPQGMALAADTDRAEVIQAAVQAAKEAATAATTATFSAFQADGQQEMPSPPPNANRCFSCGGIGHQQRVCPNNTSPQSSYGGPPLPPRQSRHVRGGFGGQRGGRGGRGMHFHPYAQRGGSAHGGAPPLSGRPPVGQQQHGGRGTHTSGGRGQPRGGMAPQNHIPSMFRGPPRPEPPAPGFVPITHIDSDNILISDLPHIIKTSKST